MEQIRNLNDGFQELVLKLWPILSDASIRGIPVSIYEHTKLTTFLISEQKRIYEQIQTKVTDEIKKISPKEGYVRTPNRVQELIEIYNQNVGRIKASGKEVVSLDKFIEKKSFHIITKVDKKTKRKREIGARCRFGRFEVLDKTTNLKTIISRWCVVEDFNPRSSKQLISYMKVQKHRVPVKLTGEETSDAKELERLAISTGDKFYDEVIEYRSISKMLSNDLPNWMPDKEGAVHTEFGFYPATGQLNSRRPNSQNVNKHKPLGKYFRRIIRARNCDRSDGTGRGRRRVLVELDYSGFHALMLGREAQSAKYIFLAQNDIHSWFGSHVISKPIGYPDINSIQEVEEFRRKLRDFKKQHKIVRDTQAKPTILGVGLGLGHKKMYWMNRERFDTKTKQLVGIKSEAQSKQLQHLIKELLPEIFEYQERVKQEAFQNTYLVSNWGFIRWFFDTRGEDGEAAVAFRVQNHAHGMLRWVIRNNEDLGYNSKYNFINTIHDSLVFEPWENELEECIRNVTKVMETPCKVLADKKVCPEGLVVRVESMYGLNWGEWEEKENPDGMRVWKG